MAQIRYVHALKHMNPLEVYNDKDPIFPGVFPLNDTRNAEKEMVGILPEEIRKLYNPVNFPEGQSGLRGFVTDEITAREQEDDDELRTKYFRAKFDHWVRENIN